MPVSLDAASAHSFCRKLANLPSASHYVVDGSGLKNVEPFGALLVSSAVKRAKQKNGASATWACIPNKSNHYATHMGFWQSMGVRHGPELGEVSGNSRHHPIECIDVQSLLNGQKYSRVAVIKSVIDRCNRLASIMCQDLDKELHKVVSYCLREMIRNVFEHSRSHQVWLCAQLWPNRQRVEVAILDEGRGLKESLRVPYAPSNDLQAILVALQEGTTTGQTDGSEPDVSDVDWYNEVGYGINPNYFSNSGYGLFIVNRLCSSIGNFMLASGSRSLCNDHGSTRVIETSHTETALRMVLHLNEADAELEKILTTIRSELGDNAPRLSASMFTSV